MRRWGCCMSCIRSRRKRDWPLVQQMTPNQFTKIKSRLSAQTRPSSSDLEGIIVDLRYFLEQSGILKVAKVKKTGDLHQLIEVRCKLISKSASIAEIAAFVERVWTEDIAYRDFEAHALHHSSDELILDFITGTRFPNRYTYITGRIMVNTDIV